MEEETILMYFDGASKGNGGSSGAAFWIKEGNESYGSYKFLEDQTNNYAEYSGLILGLEYLNDKKGDKKIKIHGDSKLVIEQMKGKWKVKAPNLIPLWSKAQELIKDKDIEFIHIERNLNSQADMLANMAVNTKSSNDVVF